MNIQKRLQIEFEFYGDEQMSANTALKIINNIFEEAQAEQLTLTDVGSNEVKLKFNEFANKQQGLDSEFVKIVNVNFWDLL